MTKLVERFEEREASVLDRDHRLLFLVGQNWWRTSLLTVRSSS
jgi:hypothetical protein